MLKYPLPVFYFPTTVILLDDEKDFLENIYHNLMISSRNKTSIYKIHTDPTLVIDEIKAISQIDLCLKRCMVQNENEITVESSEIYKEVFNEKRFAEISVLIVDYNMPKINGLDFCRSLNGCNKKKILLTGEADEKTAIAAFNEGIIDKFILKTNANLIDELNKAIAELQFNYFSDKSRQLMQNLASRHNNLHLSFEDPLFVNFFTEFCAKNSVIEHYFLELPGSFLLLDNCGKYSFFIAKADTDFAIYLTQAKHDNGTHKIIAALQRKEKVPFFGLEKNAWEFEAKNWENYLYPAQKLNAAISYYYTIIKDLDLSTHFRNRKIFSFDEYNNLNSFF